MKKRDALLYITFNLFIVIIIFEILFRALNPDIGQVLNIIKLVIPIFLMFLTIISKNKKKFSNTEKNIAMFFILFYLIFFIKIIILHDFQEFNNWLLKNNNINYIYVVIFYLSMRSLDMNVYLSKKFFKIINYVVLVISAYGFLTGQYFGTVNEQAVLDYAWVGTDKVRMMGVFGNPNHAGLYFVLVLFILDYFTIKEKKKFLNVNNILLCIFNVLTFSRTSIVIMITYLGIRNAIMNEEEKDNKVLNILKKYKGVIIIITMVVIASVLISKYKVYFFSAEYLFANPRFSKWSIGINYMLKYFIIGTPFNIDMLGFSQSYGVLAFSDNFFIEIGAQFGIIVFSYFMILVLYHLVLSIKEKNILSFNKMQLFIISSLLSGTIHFSVPMFLFIIYILFDSNKTNIEKMEGK